MFRGLFSPGIFRSILFLEYIYAIINTTQTEMSGLKIKNTIEVLADYGVRQIQLCVGSVTKSEDPVDVLVISAFPGLCYK